ncbi:hypothetical protein ScPMuIL_005250 [Solemya velum]
MMKFGVILAVIVLCWEGSHGADSLSFLVVGDWGGVPYSPYSTIVEQSCAKQMGVAAKKYKTQFTLALGDNFYYSGVDSVDDKRFKETFEDIYTSKYLNKPWFVLAGNHDHRGNVSAQIAYTKRSKRWNFPDYYYNMTFTVPHTSTVVEVVMIDTVLLCGNTDDFTILQPLGPESLSAANKQWEWLEKTLKNSKADYLLVAGHYPVYSIATHGPTKILVKKLLPLLQKYKVTAYLCGHDHNLQHLQTKKKGTQLDFFVIGSGNFIDDSQRHKSDVPSGSSKFYFAEDSGLGGFSVVNVTPSRMKFKIIDGKGDSIYSYRLKPRRN